VPWQPGLPRDCAGHARLRTVQRLYAARGLCARPQRFQQAQQAFEANIPNTVKALFRKGNADGKRKPARTGSVRKNAGWFGAAGAPDVPMDTDVISPVEFHTYVAALERTGFFGPDAWYMNHARNVAFATGASNGGKLNMPVLFLHAEYDYVCETVLSRLADPMRQDCSQLIDATVPAGHWVAQEQPVAVNAALAKWLATRLPGCWPV
jgi:pimeloyl-ACP methyl ester carboxylesterase